MRSLLTSNDKYSCVDRRSSRKSSANSHLFLDGQEHDIEEDDDDYERGADAGVTVIGGDGSLSISKFVHSSAASGL